MSTNVVVPPARDETFDASQLSEAKGPIENSIPVALSMTDHSDVDKLVMNSALRAVRLHGPRRQAVAHSCHGAA
jgi:hypothetical protein